MMATTYLSVYKEEVKERAKNRFYSHPFIYFIIMNILAAAGVLGAVCAITFLGALPLYLIFG